MGKFHFTEDDFRENARDDYKAEYIRRGDIRKNDKNGYSIDEESVMQLATSIEMGGLQNPLIVCRKPEGGTKYLLLSGERRLTAIDSLIERGAWLDQDGNETDEIPCRVTDFDTITLPLSEENKMDFSIVLTNAFNRVLTDGDRIFQTRAMRQVLDELRRNGVTKYDFGLGETDIIGKHSGTARIDRQIIAGLNQQSGSQQSLFEYVDTHGVALPVGPFGERCDHDRGRKRDRAPYPGRSGDVPGKRHRGREDHAADGKRLERGNNRGKRPGSPGIPGRKRSQGGLERGNQQTVWRLGKRTGGRKPAVSRRGRRAPLQQRRGQERTFKSAEEAGPPDPCKRRKIYLCPDPQRLAQDALRKHLNTRRTGSDQAEGFEIKKAKGGNAGGKQSMAYPTFRDEADLKQFLSEMTRNEEIYQMQKSELYYEKESLDEAIARNALSMPPLRAVAGKHGRNPDPDPVYHLIERSQKDIDKQLNEIYTRASWLKERTDHIKFVRFCIQQLPTHEISLIVLIYIDGWSMERYGDKFAMAKSTVFHRCGPALTHLLEIYDNENQEIADREAADRRMKREALRKKKLAEEGKDPEAETAEKKKAPSVTINDIPLDKVVREGLYTETETDTDTDPAKEA